MSDLLSKKGIAAMLGVSRPTVYRLIRLDSEFPEPVIDAPGMQPKWNREELEAWRNKKSANSNLL